ncbi:MAG: hypothetical protein ACRC4W_01055 [Treponemataceae bacterium]
MTTCEKIMDIFFALDKNERLPLAVTMHLLFCKKCRSEVRILTFAEKKLSEPLYIDVPLSNSAVSSIMDKIGINDQPIRTQTVSLFNWVLGGIAMILAILIFMILQKNRYFSSTTLVAIFYTVFGCYLTAYCGLFVGSNLDFFVKKISLIRFAHHTD